MAQTSGVGHEDQWGWACPYCRGTNAFDAARCAHCGTQLRDPEEDDLFTTVAADNAEVVPPQQPFGRDNMWSTDAPRPDGPGIGHQPPDEQDVDEGEVVEEDLWDPAPGSPVDDALAGFRPAFTAEPPQRPDDVVDEPFAVDDTVPGPSRHGARSPFSSATAAPGSDGLGGPGEFGLGRNPFATPGSSGVGPTGPVPSPGRQTAGDWSRDVHHRESPYERPHQDQPRYDQPRYDQPHYDQPHYDQPHHGSGRQDSHAGPLQGPQPVPDQHGLAAAVSRLRPEDQEAAAAPISVVGALLQADEVVLAAVTGQMLGHAAVIVLTTRRVIVVNGRRWQPIVDIFELGPDLVVRGRHDRDVAALSFADATRLSTVDAIGEVAIAVELAERIRGEGP